MSMIFNLLSAEGEELQRLLDDPEGVTDYIYGADGDGGALDRAIHLDKAWHGIHYTLAGDPWGGEGLSGALLLGGKPVGDIDVGYGPARVFSPEDTTAYSSYLDSISTQAFRERFDAKALAAHRIYPEIWDEDQDALDYLVQYFEELKAFFAQAAAAKRGALFVLN